MYETTIKADRNAGECARAGRVVAEDFYSTAVAHTKLSLWDIPAKYGMIINLLKTCVWRLWGRPPLDIFQFSHSAETVERDAIGRCRPLSSVLVLSLSVPHHVACRSHAEV